MRLVDSLVEDLQPTRRPRSAALWVGALAAAQVATTIALGMGRPDLFAGEMTPVLLWRVLGSAGVALFGVAFALRLRNPAAVPGLWPWAIVAVLLLIVGAGLGLDLVFPGDLSLAERLRLQAGLHCLAIVAGNALPTLVLSAWLLRRGAVVRPETAACAAGLGAAGVGGFIWALACPIDDPVYAMIWYAIAFAAVAGAARLILPQLIRLDPGVPPVGPGPRIRRDPAQDF